MEFQMVCKGTVRLLDRRGDDEPHLLVDRALGRDGRFLVLGLWEDDELLTTWVLESDADLEVGVGVQLRGVGIECGVIVSTLKQLAAEVCRIRFVLISRARAHTTEALQTLFHVISGGLDVGHGCDRTHGTTRLYEVDRVVTCAVDGSEVEGIITIVVDILRLDT